MGPREYNIVVLGSGGVGKSCLTAQFVQNVWIESYDPTIEDSYRKTLEVDVRSALLWSDLTDQGRQVVLEILDTAGTDQFKLYIKTGQGFLLVFSITSMSSLTELHELREQILRVKETDSVPLVLVGNKSDLEEDRAVSRARAFQVSQSWGRVPYYETSARRRANVDEVFKDLCRQIIRRDMDSGGGGGASGSGGARGSGGSSASHHRHGRAAERWTPPEKRERDRRDGDKREGRRRRRRRETGGPSCAIL